MEEQDINDLQKELNTTERIRFKNFSVYTLLMIALGVFISGWSVYEGSRALQFQKQSEQSQRKMDSLQLKIDKANNLLLSQREKLINNYTINGHLRLGLDYFYSKQYDLAVEEYNKAIALDPENFVLYDLKGYSQLKSKKINEAIASLEKSVELKPNYTWGHYNLSLAYWAGGKNEEAKREIKTLIGLDESFRKTISTDRQFSEMMKSIKLD